MGEYATLRRNGESIKIGTCEDMYYLRYNQREQVTALSGSVNPNDPATASELRFRFPWPDEDALEAGDDGPDHRYHRGVHVPGATVPADTEHYTVQFKADAGYLVSLPCPESKDSAWIRLAKADGTMGQVTIHRNGFSGAVHLVSQKPTPDGTTLRAIFRCGGCGAMWRAETWADAEPYVVALRAEADSRERQGQHNGTGAADRCFWDQVADRLTDGYPEGRAAALIPA